MNELKEAARKNFIHKRMLELLRKRENKHIMDTVGRDLSTSRFINRYAIHCVNYS